MSFVFEKTNNLASVLTQQLDKIQKFSKQFDDTDKPYEEKIQSYVSYLTSNEALGIDDSVLSISSEHLYWLSKESVATDFVFELLKQGGKKYLKGYDKRLGRNTTVDSETNGSIHLATFGDDEGHEYSAVVAFNNNYKVITTEFLEINLAEKTATVNREFFKSKVKQLNINVVAKIAQAILEGLKQYDSTFAIEYYELADTGDFSISVEKETIKDFEESVFDVLDDLMITMAQTGSSGIIQQIAENTHETILKEVDNGVVKESKFTLNFVDKQTTMEINLDYLFTDKDTLYYKLLKYPALEDWYYTLFA